jgi:hypothetical protein
VLIVLLFRALALCFSGLLALIAKGLCMKRKLRSSPIWSPVAVLFAVVALVLTAQASFGMEQSNQQVSQQLLAAYHHAFYLYDHAGSIAQAAADKPGHPSSDSLRRDLGLTSSEFAFFAKAASDFRQVEQTTQTRIESVERADLVTHPDSRSLTPAAKAQIHALFLEMRSREADAINAIHSGLDMNTAVTLDTSAVSLYTQARAQSILRLPSTPLLSRPTSLSSNSVQPKFSQPPNCLDTSPEEEEEEDDECVDGGGIYDLEDCTCSSESGGGGGGSGAVVLVNISGSNTSMDVSTSGSPSAITLTASGTPSGGTYSWSSSNPSFLLTGATSSTVSISSQTAGQATIGVTYTVPNGEGGNAQANNNQAVTAIPTITGTANQGSEAHDIWYFGKGVTSQSSIATAFTYSETLTANGGSNATWTVTAGSNEVTLSNASGTNSTVVSSSGTAWSML